MPKVSLIKQAFDKYCAEHRIECETWDDWSQTCPVADRCFKNFKDAGYTAPKCSSTCNCKKWC